MSTSIFNNYSFKIYSATYGAEHSLEPTLYSWVTEELGIDKNEFIIWAFIDQNLKEEEAIGVKLKDRNALVVMKRRRAYVYYTYSSDVFENHFEQDTIEFDNGFFKLDEILANREKESQENNCEEEDFWDNPEGIVTNIQLKVEELNSKLMNI